MAKNLLMNYLNDIQYLNDKINEVGATDSLTLRTVTTHTDANCKYVRKFGFDYEITDVAGIEDPVDANMKFLVYALDGTLLGSRIGGGVYVDGGTVTAQGCYLEIEASGGNVVVLATVTIDTDVDVGGKVFVCATETISDGDTLRLYLSDTTSTYYDSEYIYGGARHTPDGTEALPYFHPETADATLGGAHTLVTVLDSMIYEVEDYAMSTASTVWQSALGETPRLTNGVGARATREVSTQYNNLTAVYFNTNGDDANPGTWQEPFLTLTAAIAGHGALDVVFGGIDATSEILQEAPAFNINGFALEPDYGYVPTIYPTTAGSDIINGNATSTLKGFKINCGRIFASAIARTAIKYVGLVTDCEIYNLITVGVFTMVTIDMPQDGIVTSNYIHDISRGNGSYGIFNQIASVAGGLINKNLFINCNALWGCIKTSKFYTVEDNLIYNCNNTDGSISISHASSIVRNNTAVNGETGFNLGNIASATGNIARENSVLDLDATAPMTVTYTCYETKSADVTAGAGSTTDDPEFCKTTSPYKFGLSANSPCYRTGNVGGSIDMGAVLNMIEINESDIEINGFIFDGQEQYNNAIYILDTANHTGTIIKWNNVFDFQGIGLDPYDDGTNTDCTISNNKIYKNGNGIKLSYGGNTVEENVIYNNSVFAIHSDYTGQTFNHNVCFGNQYGIYFESNSSVMIIKNSITQGNSLFGIYSEVTILSTAITYCCIIDPVNSNVDISHSSNVKDNPLFINTNADEEDFNIKTVETGSSKDSPCKDKADDGYDIGAYKLDRSVDENSWRKYPFEFNPPVVEWSNVQKGYTENESGLGGQDNFAKEEKRKFVLNFSERQQVSSKQLRDKMKYFCSLIKTRGNQLAESKTKFRFHENPDNFLEDGEDATITTSNNNIADGTKDWTEDEHKGYHVGVIWQHGTNMVIDETLKTGTVGGAAWTVNEWTGYYMYHNGYYYYIKSNAAAALTFSDPRDTLVSGTYDWNIEKYFKISSNSETNLCVQDPDGELEDGTFDYYIDFIEVKCFTPEFNWSQPIFDMEEEHSKNGFPVVLEEL